MFRGRHAGEHAYFHTASRKGKGTRGPEIADESSGTLW